jgi:hypothetical protein
MRMEATGCLPVRPQVPHALGGGEDSGGGGGATLLGGGGGGPVGGGGAVQEGGGGRGAVGTRAPGRVEVGSGLCTGTAVAGASLDCAWC